MPRSIMVSVNRYLAGRLLPGSRVTLMSVFSTEDRRRGPMDRNDAAETPMMVSYLQVGYHLHISPLRVRPLA
jgi:hypothetical protein